MASGALVVVVLDIHVVEGGDELQLVVLVGRDDCGGALHGRVVKLSGVSATEVE